MLVFPIRNILKTFRLPYYILDKKCHSLFGIKELIQQEKQEAFTVMPIQSRDHEMAIDMVKRYYLNEHVFVRARNINLSEDRALDEYLLGLLKQGNSLLAKAEDENVAGLSVNFAVSPVDPQNLRNYAFYRQDPDTKDFLYFMAKLQETPNLWTIFRQPKIFEIKMLAVLPEYRRRGLSVMLAKTSQELARDQGYKVLRMDCINPYDFKIAERCMLTCLVRFPLHKLRGTNAPFIKRSSDYNKYVRVYVGNTGRDQEINLKKSITDLETMIE